MSPSKPGENGALKGILHRTVPWLPYVGFSCMVYSAGKAIVDTKGETGTVFFVAGSFSLLGGLLACTRELERTGGGTSRKNDLLKRAVWLLSAALTVLFSYRVSTILDSDVLSASVWIVALLTVSCGYFPLFFDFVKEPTGSAPSFVVDK